MGKSSLSLVSYLEDQQDGAHLMVGPDPLDVYKVI
jgi:hypothetical protein